MQDISLSPGAVAAITLLMGGLCTAIGVLFSKLIESKNAQIAREQDLVKREQELTSKLLPAVESGNRTLEKLVSMVENLQRDWISRIGPRE